MKEFFRPWKRVNDQENWNKDCLAFDAAVADKELSRKQRLRAERLGRMIFLRWAAEQSSCPEDMSEEHWGDIKLLMAQFG
ncbi:hypothetical protein [Fundidesulfovibrio terrae]|uniref:hypothetical protein n=1 Tax=Fundidesulfovibrio terrae TaxID=2922866 RepID=UPI001FAED376|nr:hypothetical protein [Fundidesulfovibrio terrae]